MKKRFLSAILCLCMVLTLIPTVAFAVGENETLIVQNVNDNDSFANATTLYVNASPYSDNLETNKSVNYYKFTTSSNGYISLDFGKEYVNSTSQGWQIWLYNSNQEELVSYEFRGGNSVTESTCKIGVPKDTYYIKVYHRAYESTPTVPYSLKVNFTPSNMWETEFNEEPSSADNISIGNTYYGSLIRSNDIDYFKFTTSNNGYISLDFGKEYINSTSQGWQIWLYNSNQEELVSYEFRGGNSATESTCKIGVPKDTYYIKVYHRAYNDTPTVPYSLKVNFTPSNMWETEFNEEPSSANDISVNATYYGSLRHSSDVDYFKFTLNSAASVYLDFGSELYNSTSSGWDIRIYDSYMVEKISYKHKAGTAATETFSPINLSSGLYYIKVNHIAYNDTIDVTYNFKINDPSTPIPTPIPDPDPTPDPTPSPSGSVSRIFSDVSENDWYKQAVQYVYDRRLMTGTTGTTFNPSAYVNRAMVAQILYASAGSPSVSTTSRFSDIDPNDWYAQAVSWAVNKGITSGYSNGTFQPNKNITRTEFVTMLYSAYGKPDVSGSLNYSDASSVAGWARTPMIWASQRGIISGNSINGKRLLDPSGQTTRAQAAVMIMNYDQL